MADDPNPQHSRLAPIVGGDAPDLPFDGDTSYSARAVSLTVQRDDGTATVTVASGITFSTPSAGVYRITVPLTAANTTTLLAGSTVPVDCVFSLSLTDAPVTRIAAGTVLVWPRLG